MFSILLGVEFLGVKSLGYMIILHLTFWGATKLCFTRSLPFYIPISNYTRAPILPHPPKPLLSSVLFACLFEAILVNVYAGEDAEAWRFPKWLSGEESICQCSRRRSIPGPRRCHRLWSSQARAPQLLSLCCRAWELQLLKPTQPRACALQQETPLQWEPHACN